MKCKKFTLVSTATVTLIAIYTSSIGATGVSSVIINNKENYTSLLQATEWRFDLPWIHLFLYTLSVSLIAYYLGTLLHFTSTNQNNESALNLSLSQKLFRLRGQLKFYLFSQLIHNRIGLNQIKKKIGLATNRSENVISKYELQTNELVDAILNCYVFPWYNTISDEKSFPVYSKQILLLAFAKLGKKVQQINRTVLAKEVILLLHCHWIEYCAMLDKTVRKEDNILQNFKAVHPYFENKEELAKQYETLIANSLKDILIPDLRSTLFCQFLAGILVKGFVFYYADMACDPKWLNATLVSLLTPIRNSTKESAGHLPVTPSNSSVLSLNISENGEAKNEGNSNKELSGDENGVLEEQEILTHVEQEPESRVHNEAPNSFQDSFLIRKLHKLSNATSLPGSNDQNKLTISSALSGLLSTTAIPLLPDGSTYDLTPGNNVDTQTNQNSTEITEDLFDNTATETRETETTEEVEENVTTNTCKAQCHNSRHFSVKEPPTQRDAQNHLEKTTQSLDENKTLFRVVRQEEFDSLFEPSDKKIDCNHKKNASPMYEEAEDFAATIAKLRSLLEQKESRTNLMDMVHTEADIPNGSEVFNGVNKDNTKLTESPKESSVGTSPRTNLNSQSSISSVGTEGSTGSSISQSMEVDKMDPIEDELEETEMELRRVFLNVVISKTETCGDSSAQSILFCIEYEGVYIEDGDDENTQKLVLRTTTVKRRFKEFLTLQSQLEENPIWKPHLKQIKTPTKWLTLSFPNQNSINQKKIFLEKYLQQICYHPILGFSPEIRQFMAYGEDGFQAFEMLTSSSLSFHRLDKLAKTFAGVFNSLKDVLPSFEPDAFSAPNSPVDAENKGRFSPNDPKAKKMFASFFNFGERISAQKLKNQQILQLETEIGLKNSIADSEDKARLDTDNSELNTSEIEVTEPEDKSHCLNEENLNCIEGADLLLNESLESVYPLASVFTQLLCDVLWLPPQRPHSTSVAAFMSISGKSLENYLQESLKVLLSEDAFVIYLDWLTCSINDWITPDSTTVTSQEETQEEFTEADLKNSLRQKIPAWARWMWGRKKLEVTINRLTRFCQHTELNHDFILSVVELIFSKMTENCDELYDNVGTEEGG